MASPEADPSPDTLQNGDGRQERSHDEALEAARSVLQRADEKRVALKKRVDAPAPVPETREVLDLDANAPPVGDRVHTGGASPEVETGDDREPTSWGPRWEAVRAELDAAETRVEAARARRRELFEEMRRTMTLGQIAEVTGVTRQRVSQLVKKA